MAAPTAKIRSSVPMINILDIYQRRRTEESCDIHIICQDGYIPCHKFILMANSNFLNQLIIDNLSEIGHMDNGSIVSMSFPEFKTRHMAHVISMFDTGKSVCYLRDIFYIKRIMEVLGIKFNTPKQATMNEISNFYKPRYFISEYDSDTEEEANGSRFTTNAFCALRQNRSTNRQNQNKLKPAESGHLHNTKIIKKEIVTEQDTNTATIELPISTSELFEPQNTINAPAKNEYAESGSNLVKLDINGTYENTKTDQETENIEPTSKNTSYPQTSTPRTEKFQEGKRKAEDESDCEFDSADSALEIIRVRKRKLRKRTPKQQQGSLIKPRKSRKSTGTKLSGITVKVESEPVENAAQEEVDVMCYFCLNAFTNEEDLGVHLSLNCGKHLKGNYCIPSKTCDFCHENFPLLSVWDFIQHVDSCYQTGKSKQKDNKSPTRKSYRIMEAAKKQKNEFDESPDTLKSTDGTNFKTDNKDTSETVNLTINSLLQEDDKDIEEFERQNFNRPQNCDLRSEGEIVSPVAPQSEKQFQEYESTKHNLYFDTPSPKNDQMSDESPSITFPFDMSRVMQRFRDESFEGNPERNDVNEQSTSAVATAQYTVPWPDSPSLQAVGFAVPKIPGLIQSPSSAKKTLE